MISDSQRLARLKKHARECNLCGNRCGVERGSEASICGAGLKAEIARIVVHHGEEPPIAGHRGCGNFFFLHCGLACVFCQNWQISNAKEVQPRGISAGEMATEMLRQQETGVHAIGLVSAVSHLPTVVPALMQVRDDLTIPVVYNSGGYETVAALELLDGLVDVYLPDMKYASSEAAKVYSGVTDYVSVNRLAVLEMFRQVGGLRLDGEGLALAGMLVRHLPLPGGASDTVEVLQWIARNLPRSVHVSLMSQYHPAYQAAAGLFPELNRTLSPEEYEFYVDAARQLGLTNVYVQQLDSTEHYNPDFSKEEPFA